MILVMMMYRDTIIRMHSRISVSTAGLNPPILVHVPCVLILMMKNQKQERDMFARYEKCITMLNASGPGLRSFYFQIDY